MGVTREKEDLKKRVISIIRSRSSQSLYRVRSNDDLRGRHDVYVRDIA